MLLAALGYLTSLGVLLVGCCLNDCVACVLITCCLIACLLHWFVWGLFVVFV